MSGVSCSLKAYHSSFYTLYSRSSVSTGPEPISKEKNPESCKRCSLSLPGRLIVLESHNTLEMMDSTRKVVLICKYSATLCKRPWPPQIVVSSGWRVSLEPVPSWRQGRLWACSCQRFSVYGLRCSLCCPHRSAFSGCAPFCLCKFYPLWGN